MHFDNQIGLIGFWFFTALDARVHLADHFVVFRLGLFPPLFDFTFDHRAAASFVLMIPIQHRQRDFRTTGHRQIGGKTPTGNSGEHRIAFQMNDLHPVAQNVAVGRLPRHVGVDEKQHIGLTHILGRLRAEIERMIGGKIDIAQLLHHGNRQQLGQLDQALHRFGIAAEIFGDDQAGSRRRSASSAAFSSDA